MRSLEGQIEAENREHLFVEKQVIAVTVKNAFMDGHVDAIPYTFCEIYGHFELFTNVSVSILSRKFYFEFNNSLDI